MADLQLIIAEQEVTIPKAIENLEQLKAELTPLLETYKNIIVSEDGIKQAKEDKAKLNKLRTAIEDRRKDAKKQILSYYTPLENECKTIVEMIDEPVESIDKQIKAFEEKYKSEKLATLKTAFYKTNHPEWLEFNRVVPEKWENKTAKTDKLIEEITSTVDRINSDITAIKEDFGDKPYFTAIAKEYKNNLDKAVTYEYAMKLGKEYEEYEKRKAEEEQARQKAEEERRQAEEQARKQAGMQTATENAENVPNSSADGSNVITPPTEQTAVNEPSNALDSVLSGTFTVTCKKSQLKALVQYMKSNGIEYRMGN